MPPFVTAYGSRRYLAPLEHRLLSFTARRRRCLHHHHHLPRLPPPPLAPLSSCNLPSPSGNSLFRGMEQYLTGRGINKNKAMVEHLQHYGVLRSKKLAEVMETIDRALFVPEGNPPYVDSPMPIGYNATISAPHMHATCLQLLEGKLKPGMRALDVGSGIQNIKKSAAAPLLKKGSLSVHVGDGRLGRPASAPYDAIHVGAASPEIPPALLEQLNPGGRMVIPVGEMFQNLKVIDKNADGSISAWTETSVSYVPLTSRESQLQGY
ncbi:protein-L-isoaspartate O-methyltransferase-like isoform X2 [Diospyros lotus]|uniref:protein-L-isoaspartate O-methyltransferase-like isoform X2 n=1 Tax=Diospyros lotus TaxID=55363 RepID=UPI0022513E62|nr:protein-L-isoaspartate O-methyltransferase-like isoform X2 [Diospyros lotus]